MTIMNTAIFSLLFIAGTILFMKTSLPKICRATGIILGAFSWTEMAVMII